MPHEPQSVYHRLQPPPEFDYDKWAAEVAEQYRREDRRDRYISAVMIVAFFAAIGTYGAMELISRI